MSTCSFDAVKQVAPGIILALLAVLFGFGLGGALGVAEDPIKGHLLSSADAAPDSVYKGDTKKKDAVVKKSWRYVKRAHMHAGSIGVTALACILLLLLLGKPGPVEKATAIAFGAGGLLYALFWMFAGLKAPGLGSTSAAKESLRFMAMPGVALCLLGLCGTLFAVIRRLFAKPPAAEPS